MGGMDIGGGISALAFWGFLAVCVWAGIWSAVRRREAEQATLRALIASGAGLDAAAREALLKGGGRLADALRAYGFVTILIAPGIALAAFPLGALAPWVFPAMMGAATITGFTGAGLLAASRFGARG